MACCLCCLCLGGGARRLALLRSGLALRCREQLGKLYAHVELASRINRAIDERALEELGTLEQDLVYGDATSKEVITFLSNKDHAGALPADKVPSPLLPSLRALHFWPQCPTTPSPLPGRLHENTFHAMCAVGPGQVCIHGCL